MPNRFDQYKPLAEPVSMVSPMPSNTPPVIEHAEGEAINKFLRANGLGSQASGEMPPASSSNNRKLEHLN